MSSYDNYEKIIETWVKKGDIENDIFSKFICYWIAFNCWLCTKTSEIHDPKALKKLYESEYLYTNFDELVIENEEILQNLVRECPIENNRKPDVKFITNIKNFQEIVDVLYLIRCNLFHGSKADTNERDKNVLNAATPVLELIVKQIID